jgi:hypothetical protein
MVKALRARTCRHIRGKSIARKAARDKVGAFRFPLQKAGGYLQIQIAPRSSAAVQAIVKTRCRLDGGACARVPVIAFACRTTESWYSRTEERKLESFRAAVPRGA